MAGQSGLARPPPRWPPGRCSRPWPIWRPPRSPGRLPVDLAPQAPASAPGLFFSGLGRPPGRAARRDRPLRPPDLRRSPSPGIGRDRPPAPGAARRHPATRPDPAARSRAPPASLPCPGSRQISPGAPRPFALALTSRFYWGFRKLLPSGSPVKPSGSRQIGRQIRPDPARSGRSPQQPARSSGLPDPRPASPEAATSPPAPSDRPARVNPLPGRQIGRSSPASARARPSAARSPRWEGSPAAIRPAGSAAAGKIAPARIVGQIVNPSSGQLGTARKPVNGRSPPGGVAPGRGWGVTERVHPSGLFLQ